MKKHRILTLQDYSCMGRCSLTVTQPTISAMGIECVGVPTAVLSNHTAFPSWTYLDLTSELLKMVGKWDGFNESFDFVYTGYLSNDQVPVIAQIVAKYKAKGAKSFIDPAMADQGKLYPGFDSSHVEAMKTLFKDADYVKPNLTEACLLTNTPYHGESVNDGDYIDALLEKVAALGPKFVILSGVEIGNGEIATFVYDGEKGEVDSIVGKKLSGRYHGTGDLFASCLVGALALGKSIHASVKIAHEYTSAAIRKTIEANLDGVTYGPEFEQAIPTLLNLLD